MSCSTTVNTLNSISAVWTASLQISRLQKVRKEQQQGTPPATCSRQQTRHDLAFGALFAAALNSRHLTRPPGALQFNSGTRRQTLHVSNNSGEAAHGTSSQLHFRSAGWSLFTRRREAGTEENEWNSNGKTGKRRTTQEFLPGQKLIEWGHPSHGTLARRQQRTVHLFSPSPVRFVRLVPCRTAGCQLSGFRNCASSIV